MIEIIFGEDNEPPSLSFGESVCHRGDGTNHPPKHVYRLPVWFRGMGTANGTACLSNLSYLVKHGGVPMDVGVTD
jgi:hypothetical protein